MFPRFMVYSCRSIVHDTASQSTPAARNPSVAYRDIHFRRPVSASIGQGRSHGSRGQVDKSPFPARRSGGGEEKKNERFRARGRRDGWRRGATEKEIRNSSLAPDSRSRMGLIFPGSSLSYDLISVFFDHGAGDRILFLF